MIYLFFESHDAYVNASQKYFRTHFEMHRCVIRVIIVDLLLRNTLSQIFQVLFDVSQSLRSLSNQRCLSFWDLVLRSIREDRDIFFEHDIESFIDRWMNAIVIREHCHRQQLRSIILLVIAIHTQIMFQHLILTLRLIICLRMKRSAKSALRIKMSTQSRLKLARE